MSRPPVVTNIDRKWALDQCPKWATLGGDDDAQDDGFGEIVDETDFERAQRLKSKREVTTVFRWDWFVDDQADSFERFFAGERKTSEEWSNLWRRSWWPQADPRKRMPKTMAKLIPHEPHPFARRGTPAFHVGLKLATADERRLFERVGVVQFKPDDARAAKLSKALSSTSRRMTGERDE